MPKGIPKHKKPETIVPPVEESRQIEEPKSEEPKKVVPALEPLQPGQAYFESPEGEIIIGEDTKGHVWSRKMNGGKGGWANKKR